MKTNFSILFAIFCCLSFSVTAKDYEWERYYASYQFLMNKYSALSGNDEEKFAEAFALEYYDTNKNISHSILINKEGDITYDGKKVSISQAKNEIMSKDNLYPQTVVFFSTVVWGKKSEKSFKRLMKEVAKLVEKREEKGIYFQSFPVLCNNMLSTKKIDKKIAEIKQKSLFTPPAPSQNTLVEKTEKSPQTTSNITKEKQQTSNVLTTEKSTEKETHVYLHQVQTEDYKPYIVHVNTYLSIRQHPSTNSKRIGSLKNNEEVSVLEIKNGWAKILYKNQYAYISSSYITEKNISTVNQNKSIKLFSGNIHEAIHTFTPFLVLLLSIFLLFMKQGCRTLIFIIGLSELLFSIVTEDGIPWFCNPSKVGWIMTIIDFIFLSTILYGQYNMYKGLMTELRPNFIIYLLSFPIIIGIGFALLTAFINPLYGIAGIVIGILIVWFTLYWYTNTGGYSFRLAIWIIISFGGAAALFLKTAPVLIAGGVILIIIRAVGEGSRQSSYYESESCCSNDEGYIDESGNGVPYVRHRDGSTTQLHDSGGGVMRDSEGHIWHSNGNGHAQRVT